ncbi:predicted protein [Histoplasma capsulatum G186AR]|uniref:Uncharacterized protein n=2 Tax=Ajellomyces capsulatus TaxID=5037 RepID=C0NNI4_AJECG|nr:uncharacterized protein HCBG_04714 [Histoplasma capsulatum G186AR]EEH06494.1 predicted protein [Histoplasma capsulatum G186AR]KAG5304986.1 hypothetical protein I7I52_03507 [Histoplasma capsulatum]QSS75945.1 hypothetical protein I7I50_05248 [Histoplasma capsulatum G186AR]
MAPTHEAQRRLALPTLLSYLYALIPLSVLLSIAFIKRHNNRSRYPASGNITHQDLTPNFSEKHITTDNVNENAIGQCTAGTVIPSRQAQQLETSACSPADRAPKMKSPEETATPSTTLVNAQTQSWLQLSNQSSMLPAQPSPFPAGLPRLQSGVSPGAVRMTPPAPHWQPEETSRPADGRSKIHPHPHPFGSPVMQKQPVDFPQVQREEVQFFPRAGPDKRQAWRRRILECN